MEAVPVAENRVPVGRPLGIRIAVGIAALSVGLQLLTKAMLFRTLSQAPDLKAAASSIPLWLNLFSWAYLIGLAASAYGVWMRQRAARIVFNALLAITLVTAVVSTLNIVANLSAARSLTPPDYLSVDVHQPHLPWPQGRHAGRRQSPLVAGVVGPRSGDGGELGQHAVPPLPQDSGCDVIPN